MRKIKLVLSFFCLLCVLAGCWRQEDTVPDTQRGYNIYRACQTWSIFYITNKVDLMMKFNSWYVANNQERNTIKNKWFRQYDIVEIEHGVFSFYDMMNRYEYAFSINTQGKSMADEDSHWTYRWYSGNASPKNQAIGYWWDKDMIICSSFRGCGWVDLHVDREVSDMPLELCWRVSMAEKDSLHSFIDWRLDLQSAEMPQTLFEGDFYISGSGCYKYVENYNSAWHVDCETETYLKYEIRSPMCWYASIGNVDDLCWYGGSMDLEAFDLQGNALPVKAEYVKPKNVKITYKGVSQVWNVQSGRVVE
ncbi:MAG: hypothetical protein IJU33_10565 [Bacteroidales bacterium]|nr:hypothetical protein [Bacteroidales bacterium]